MTSFNMNYCGPFNRSGHMHHMLDPDEDGNVICVRPGCGHCSERKCTCRIDPDWTKYVGCPTHTENPRVVGDCRYGSPEYAEAERWFPEDMGGELTLEQAEHSARELRHRPR